MTRAHGAGGRLSPFPFHLLNWSVHLLNSWLVFWLLKRVWGSTATEATRTDANSAATAELAIRDLTTPGRVVWPALAGALFWGLHPLQAEAVGWATGFKDLGSAFFSLLSLYCFFRGVDGACEATLSRARQVLWTALATLAFLAALLAKPSAVTLPLAILTWLAFGPRSAHGTPPRNSLSWRLPAAWLILSALLVVVSARVQSGGAPVLVSPWQRPFIASDALAFYAQKTLWPVNLAMHYGRTPAKVLAGGHMALALVALIIVVASTVSAYRHQWRVPAWALGTWVVFLLPVLGIVPFTYQNLSTVADRYAYLALIGPALGITWALGNAWRRPATTRLLWALTCVWLLISGGLTLRQTAYWHSTRAMALHTLEVNPQSWVAECLLGDIASHGGDFTGALADYRKAMADNPHFARAFSAAGVALAHLNRLDEARATFLQASNIPYAPTDTRSVDDANLGMIAEIQGDPDAARAFYAAALVFNPDDNNVRDRLNRLNH